MEFAAVFIALFLSRRNRRPRYTWAPAIHVEDATVRAALIPFGMS